MFDALWQLRAVCRVFSTDRALSGTPACAIASSHSRLNPRYVPLGMFVGVVLCGAPTRLVDTRAAEYFRHMAEEEKCAALTAIDGSSLEELASCIQRALELTCFTL